MKNDTGVAEVSLTYSSKVSAKHLHRYCDEYAYRYNTRKVNDRERFIVSLTKVDGRLTYKNLIKKNEK